MYHCSFNHYKFSMLTWLSKSTPFPVLEKALTNPSGLVAAGGDLTPARLIDAYRQGIFPWYSEGEPIMWWSLDPRMVMFPNEFKLHRSLEKVVRSKRFTVTRDTAFAQVIHNCAQTPRAGQGGTWIQPEMIEAYIELHRLGYAHSVETWLDSTLVGGLYGIKLGPVFFGESMFAHITDASKVAFAHLIQHLKSLDVKVIDCQQQTAHLTSLGARPIARSEFRKMLDSLIQLPVKAERWSAKDDAT
jgi:leucyl/phenylalanyl-tRNA---protein transferase